MPSDDFIAANPNAGQAQGQAAEEVAAGFRGLVVDFEDLVEAAKIACGSEPGIDGAAWNAYSSSQANFMSDVQNHGLNIAHGVQNAASSSGNTDGDSADEFLTTAFGSIFNRGPND